MSNSPPYCNFHGCPNKATILHYHHVFTNDDGVSKWDLYVNCCDEHWDDLIMDRDAEHRRFKPRE